MLVKDGSRIRGHLYAANVDGDFALALRGAHTTASPKPQAELVVSAQDFVAMTFLTEQGTFMTDTAISGGVGPRERELQKWTPTDALPDLTLETSGTTSWDQFSVNEKKFGVTTDFNEEMYTTKLDKSRPEVKAREAEAARIAAEIERGVVTNVHMAEERGMQVDGDEEELYSSVIRDGKYMPPGLKNPIEKIDKKRPVVKPEARPPTPKETAKDTVKETRPTTPKETRPPTPKEIVKERPPTPKEKYSPHPSPSVESPSRQTFVDTAIAFRDYSQKERAQLQARSKNIQTHGDLQSQWKSFKEFSEKLSVKGSSGRETTERPKTSASIHSTTAETPPRKSSEPNLEPTLDQVKEQSKEQKDTDQKHKQQKDKDEKEKDEKEKDEKEKEFKFNVDAAEFSFNIGAEEFVPGGSPPATAPPVEGNPYYQKGRPQQGRGRGGMKEAYVGGYQKKGTFSPCRG